MPARLRYVQSPFHPHHHGPAAAAALNRQGPVWSEAVEDENVAAAQRYNLPVTAGKFVFSDRKPSTVGILLVTKGPGPGARNYFQRARRFADMVERDPAGKAHGTAAGVRFTDHVLMPRAACGRQSRDSSARSNGLTCARHRRQQLFCNRSES